MQEERQRNFQEKLGAIVKMAALNVPIEKIAEILGLDENLVRQQLAHLVP